MIGLKLTPIFILLILLSIAPPSLEFDEYHKNIRPLKARGAPKNVRELDPIFWEAEAMAGIEQLERDGLGRRRHGKARNLVMFLGDGMSVPTLTAARTLLGQRRNHTGEEARLSFETFPTVGLAKTYCVDGQIPDSACTATAYLCGTKTNVGTIGVNAHVARWSCNVNQKDHVQSIAAWALADGRDAAGRGAVVK